MHLPRFGVFRGSQRRRSNKRPTNHFTSIFLHPFTSTMRQGGSKTERPSHSAIRRQARHNIAMKLKCVPPVKPSPPTFQPFTRLPIELRLMSWELHFKHHSAEMKVKYRGTTSFALRTTSNGSALHMYFSNHFRRRLVWMMNVLHVHNVSRGILIDFFVRHHDRDD